MTETSDRIYKRDYHKVTLRWLYDKSPVSILSSKFIVSLATTAADSNSKFPGDRGWTVQPDLGEPPNIFRFQALNRLPVR